MATIDPAKLTEDLEYAYSVFWRFLSQTVSQGSKKQYYYEYSGRYLFFEELMYNNMIAIEAWSLEEAKVLSAILRVIIDMHPASLDLYLEYIDSDEDVFFNAIKVTNELNEHHGYVSNTLKPMKSTEIGSKQINVIIMDTVKVFNRQLIMDIIRPDNVPITTVDQVRDLLGAKSQHPRLSATKQAHQQQEEEED